MNIPFSAPRPVLPRVTLTLLAALVLLAPYAMSFTPFSGVYTSGTYHAPHETDPLWERRVFLVAFGLCAAVIPVFEILALLLIRRLNMPGILTGLSTWFACAAVALVFLFGFSPGYGEWLMD